MRDTPKLSALHLLGNGLLMLVAYYWLGLGESDAAHLLFSAAVILLVILAAIWLHGTAFVFFRSGLGLRGSASRTFRNLTPLLALTFVAGIIYWLLAIAYHSFGHAAFTVGSYTTMKIRRPVAPQNILNGFHFFIWLVRWFVLPAFLLPLASEVSNEGWAGFRRFAFQKTATILFWMEATVTLVAAIELPLYLFYWVPKVSEFSLEVVSVVARIGLGYLLLTAGFLLLEYFSSAGNPRATQLNTVPSP